MNKADLTAHVAKAAGMTHEQAGKAIIAIMATIQETLVAGEQVTLVGFGSFSVAERAARTGRNPQTGETIQIAAGRVPHFKPGQTLRTAVALKAVEAQKAVVAAKTAAVPKPKIDEKKKK